MIFCNVNEDEFEYDKEFVKNNVVYREIKLKNRGTRCINCSCFITNVKEYRVRKIKHSLYANKKCIIIYHQRRFICPKCRTTRMENNPFSINRKHISDKTVNDILDTLKRYNVPFTQAAEMYNVSTKTVMNIFDTYCKQPKGVLSSIICLDEIYFSRTRKKKYVLIIINFKNRALIDVLKDRDKSTLSSYFKSIDRKERERVEYVGVDMNDIYREIVYRYFPNATIVADSFHVVKNIYNALDDVRKRVMRRYEDNRRSDQYYMLKYRKELLFEKDIASNTFKEVKRNHHFHYDLSEFEILNMMLKIDKDLKNAYELYHQYLRFNDTDYKDTITSLNDLNEIINDYKISGINEFVNVAHTLENWKVEIVNSFIKYNGVRVSNGPIEGRNSLIKKILKIANGYSNFKRFRNRVIYCLNKYSTHSFNK